MEHYVDVWFVVGWLLVLNARAGTAMKVVGAGAGWIAVCEVDYLDEPAIDVVRWWKAGQPHVSVFTKPSPKMTLRWADDREAIIGFLGGTRDGRRGVYVTKEGVAIRDFRTGRKELLAPLWQFSAPNREWLSSNGKWLVVPISGSERDRLLVVSLDGPKHVSREIDVPGHVAWTGFRAFGDVVQIDVVTSQPRWDHWSRKDLGICNEDQWDGKRFGQMYWGQIATTYLSDLSRVEPTLELVNGAHEVSDDPALAVGSNYRLILKSSRGFRAVDGAAMVSLRSGKRRVVRVPTQFSGDVLVTGDRAIPKVADWPRRRPCSAPVLDLGSGRVVGWSPSEPLGLDANGRVLVSRGETYDGGFVDDFEWIDVVGLPRPRGSCASPSESSSSKRGEVISREELERTPM